MPGQFIPAVLAGNSSASFGSFAFRVAVVGVQNPSSTWLGFPDLGTFVPPFFFGALIPVGLAQGNTIRITTNVAPPNYTLDTSKLGTATLYFFEDFVGATMGSYQNPGSASTGITTITGNVNVTGVTQVATQIPTYVTPATATAGTILGDVTSAGLAADSVTETITTQGTPILTSGIACASFTPSVVGTQPKLVGSAGTVAIGTSTSVSPAFGQATTSGNFAIACVTAGASPTTSQAGWAKVVESSGANAAIWSKPNIGASETAPTFTSTGGTAMHAQLLEFSGVKTTTPTDQTGSTSFGATVVTVTNAAADAQATDLFISCSRWTLTSSATATFDDQVNNGATFTDTGSTGATSDVRQSNFGYALIPNTKGSQPLGVASWAYDATGTSAPTAGSQASVVLAATTGKTYTAAAILIGAGQGAATVQQAVVTLLDGATTLATIPQYLLGAAGNNVTFGQSGLAFKGTKGNSMTLQFGAGTTSVSQAVTIGAYLR